MYELLYTSVALKEFSEKELLALLETSREKNTAADITGMLVCHGREFMQILEGDEAAVKSLFAIIRADPRHTSVEIFYEGPVEQRAFTNWAMGFQRLDPTSAAALVSGFDPSDVDQTPIAMCSASPNRGKKSFLKLREML